MWEIFKAPLRNLRVPHSTKCYIRYVSLSCAILLFVNICCEKHRKGSLYGTTSLVACRGKERLFVKKYTICIGKDKQDLKEAALSKLELHKGTLKTIKTVILLLVVLFLVKLISIQWLVSSPCFSVWYRFLSDAQHQRFNFPLICVKPFFFLIKWASLCCRLCFVFPHPFTRLKFLVVSTS